MVLATFYYLMYISLPLRLKVVKYGVMGILFQFLLLYLHSESEFSINLLSYLFMEEFVSWLTEYGFKHIGDGVWYRYITPDSTYRVTIRSEDVLFTYRMYCGSPNNELIKVEQNTCISYSSLRQCCDCRNAG